MSAVTNNSMIAPRQIMVPASSSDGLGPYLPTTRPEIGEQISTRQSERQRAQSGLKRREPANRLQIKRVEEQKAAECAERS